MHFSIPDCTEVPEASGSSSYLVYNIFINGSFHSAVRFRELHQFHEQLRKEFGARISVKFPPKKLLSLTANQVEERRAQLEHYFQQISQDPDIVNCGIFVRFLLNAQKGFHKEKVHDVDLDVYFLNGRKTTVRVLSTDSSDDVVETALAEINVSERFVHYFCLFLMKKNADGEECIVRSLESFECPYLCMKSLEEPHKLVIRKNYWDLSIDNALIEDKVARDLLYIQAVSDMDRGWVAMTEDSCKKLLALKKQGAKTEFLHLAQKLKYYGFIQFKNCTTNYPAENTPVIVSIGARELNFRIQNNDKMQEGSFNVTRMKCWKLTSVSDENEEQPVIELSFEYLFSKTKMEWITIYSQEAIFMSLCLQSIVDEIIRERDGKQIKQPSNRPKTKQSKEEGSLSAATQLCETDGDKDTNAVKRISRQISEKVQNFNFAKEKGETSTTTVENELFSGIGNDDL